MTVQLCTAYKMDDHLRNTTSSTSTRKKNMSHSWNSPIQGQPGGFNKFANDGSFMDMFRKKMEEEKEKNSGSESANTKVTIPTSSTTSTQLNSKEEAKSTTKNGTFPASEKPSILSFVSRQD